MSVFSPGVRGLLTLLINSGKEPMTLRLNRDALLQAMKKAGLSQIDLSRRTGIHRNTIWGLLAGKQQPSLSTVNALAATLNVSPFVLLMDIEEEEE